MFITQVGAHLVDGDGTCRVGLQSVVRPPDLVVQPAFYRAIADQQGAMPSRITSLSLA